MIGAFPLDLEIIHPHREQLRSVEFAFQPKTAAAVQEYLTKAAEQRRRQGDPAVTEPVFVGVHVRRTDYSVWLERKLKGQLVSEEKTGNFS